jgi:tRNA1(Val) A37 N6-methylase TrmN6
VKDSHYTPSALAEYLVSRIKKKKVKTIADFCVGEGNLLKAAQKKWSSAIFFGNDVSRQVIRLLKQKYPKWKLESCDFLNQKSRNNSNQFKKKYDVILLNPPFTCRGSIIKQVFFDNVEYNVSTAMAFFIESIKYLSTDGVLYAILPQSVAYSQKDEKIRKYLSEKYDFKIFEEIENQEFEKCSPSIILAAIKDKKLHVPENRLFAQINTEIKILEVKRGKISMYKIKKARKNTLPLVHSTNIRDNTIENITYNVKEDASKIKGPAVLINRVGQPDIRKICIIPSKKEYALSDCIIGIKTKTANDSKLLKKIIIDNWSSFSNLYKGTGAKYITVKRIRYFLKLELEP